MSARVRDTGWLALVVVVLGLATAFQVLPPPRQWGSTFATNVGDPAFLMWQMVENTHHPTSLMQGNIFWPDNNVMAYSDTLVAYLPVFSPVYKLTGGNPVAAYNACLFAGYLAGALAVYALVAYLVKSRAAALIAAVLFTLAPYRSAAVGHMQLMGFCFVVLALLFLMRSIDDRRWRHAGLFGAFTGLTWLGSLYCFMMLVCLVAAYLAVWVALHTRNLGERLWRGLALSGVVAAAMIAPTLPAYVAVERTGALTRTASTIVSARPASFSFLPGSTLYRALGHGGDIPDFAALYPGTLLFAASAIGIIALTTGAILRLRRRQRPESGAAERAAERSIPPGRLEAHLLPLIGGVAVCGMVLIGPNHGLLLSGPDRALRRFLPGMASLRDLTRFWLVFLVFAALLAAVGVAWATRRLKPPLPEAIAILICVAAGFELVYSHSWAVVDFSGARAQVDQALGAMAPGPVIELPLPPDDTYDYAFTVAPRELRSTIDDHPRVEGYSGNVPDDVRANLAIARRIPDPAALDALRARGLRYLILHGASDACTADYSPAELADLVSALGALPDAVETITAVGSDRIVVLRPAPPGAAPEAPPGAPAPRAAVPPCDYH